jgi:hypothetical protein
VSKDVQVLQGAACAPAANTISCFSTMTFNALTFKPDPVYYKLIGSGQQGDFYIEFYNDPIAKGNFVYNLSTQNRGPSSAFMQIDVPYSIAANWQATSGKLYVSVSNRKITASFCGATFLNSQSTATKTGSGKISSP